MIVSAPGKIILAGEHAVVYGKPALVVTIDRRLRVEIKKKKGKKIEIFSNESLEQVKEAIKKFKETYMTPRDRWLQHTSGFEIKVDSQIPIRVGMGSSAAVAVATTGGLLAFFKNLKKFSFKDKKTINKIAYEVEKKIHINPSGVDNTISTFGGFLWFRKGKPFKKIKLKNLPRFVLVNTGKAEETTGEMVKKVSSKFKMIFDKIEEETTRLLLGLKGKDEKETMVAIRGCEQELEKLGVVGEFAKRVVREIESLGGAAKICGAGGVKDRSGILLCYHQKPARLFALAKRLNLKTFEVELGEEGVRIEDY